MKSFNLKHLILLTFSVYIVVTGPPVWSMSCVGVVQGHVFKFEPHYMKKLFQINQNLRQKLTSRKSKIERLLEEVNGNPDKAFSLIFGVKATGLKMVNTEFGLYFHGSYEVFRRVYPQFSEMFHGGAMVGIESRNLLQRPEFAGMVGFGSKESGEHEIEHMLNAMILELAYKEFNSIVVDINRSTDRESMKRIYEEKYRLWSESNLKDEILVRISNGQIHQTKTQDASDVYSGEGLVFTSYEPDSLFPYLSPYKKDVQSYGVEPLSRRQSDIFSKKEKEVRDPIRKRWISVYNQTVLEIQDALRRDVPAKDIKSTIVTNSLEQVPSVLRNMVP